MLKGASLVAASPFIGRAADYLFGVDSILGISVSVAVAALGGAMIGYGFFRRRALY
jgi:hypothetical protein